MKELNLSHQYLTKLPPKFPEDLKVLMCSDNSLTVLPNNLPDGLKELYCGANKLMSLPEQLPSSLKILYCGSNRLTELPASLPYLKTLNCSYNQLTVITMLPISLTDLNCGYNKLVTFPTLPASLKELICPNNKLTMLPKLSETLEVLNCKNNLLTSLPTLPGSLQVLKCDPNLISLNLIFPYKLTRLNDRDISQTLKLDQYNAKRYQLGLPSTDVWPTFEQWQDIMYPKRSASRILDIGISLRSSGLNPHTVAQIIDWERKQSDLLDIPAFEISRLEEFLDTNVYNQIIEVPDESFTTSTNAIVKEGKTFVKKAPKRLLTLRKFPKEDLNKVNTNNHSIISFIKSDRK